MNSDQLVPLHIPSAGHSRPGGVQCNEGAVHEDGRRFPHRVFRHRQGQLRTCRQVPSTHTTGQRQVRWSGADALSEQLIVINLVSGQKMREAEFVVLKISCRVFWCLIDHLSLPGKERILSYCYEPWAPKECVLCIFKYSISNITGNGFLIWNSHLYSNKTVFLCFHLK